LRGNAFLRCHSILVFLRIRSAFLTNCCLALGEDLVSRAFFSGLLRGLCRWRSWVCACVSGTNLSSALKAQRRIGYRLNCLDRSLSHHAVQRFLPDQPGSRALPTFRAKPSRQRLRGSRDTPLCVVDLFARHQRPCDARHLVGERHCHQPDGTALQPSRRAHPKITALTVESLRFGGVDRVVPFSVERVPGDMETIHFGVGYDNPLRIMRVGLNRTVPSLVRTS